MRKKYLSAGAIALAFGLASYNDISKSFSSAQIDSLYDKMPDEEKRMSKNAVAGLEPAKGLAVSLFSSEPTITNPTNLDVDSKGRVWLTEAFNYRTEINPTHPVKQEGDRIMILEDTNGDGVADKSKVYYQGTDINAALGIAVFGNKVIVSCSPKVFMFTDTDGDDKPDKKEVLYTGIAGEQHDHAVHSFTFGPDGKFYFNFGNAGEQILDKNGKAVVDKDGKEVNAKGNPYRQGMIFRVNPDGSEFEVLAHNFRNNYEAAVDSYGTLWQSDNDDDGNQGVRINYVMEFGNYGYTDEMTGAGWQSYRTNWEKEIPKRHWHQNDPGTMPNLLFTGSGSPTGMIVYEGNLLPEEFRNQMIHCEPGHNIVRSYPVKNSGAGYSGSIVPVVKGRDQWFRPSDVCVAPDGSLIVTDWYDPGVGGHQVGDLNRGRVFRVAPAGVAYKTAALDLSTPESAVKALQNPNLATRYLAWTQLHEWGTKAEPALKKLWSSDNQRMRARALWLLGKIEGKSKKYISEALKDKNQDIRIAGLRLARQTEKDIIPYAKQLVKDPSAQVRREVLVALHHNKSPEAAVLWAELASKYDGQDRWYLEALGIGADEQWDAFFPVWKAKAGNLNTKAASDIVWRSRTKLALPILADMIKNQSTPAADRLRYFRAFDFIKDDSKGQILTSLLKYNGADKEEIVKTTLEIIPASTVNNSAELQAILEKNLQSLKGKQAFLELIKKYQVKNHNQDLFAMAMTEGNFRNDAARLLLSNNGVGLFQSALKDPAKAPQAIEALGAADNNDGRKILEGIMFDKAERIELREAAVKQYGKGWSAEDNLLKMAKEGKLPKELNAAAAATLKSAIKGGVREEAAKLFSSVGTNTSEKKSLNIDALAKRTGQSKAGEKVFMQTCTVCHQAGNKGVKFGPALTQIGGKLTKGALYTAIVDPDAGISFGYEGYTIKLKDGSEMGGIITSKTEDVVEVSSPGGAKTKMEKSKIASMTEMKGSMMPKGLDEAMSQQDLVNLVEYLYSLK